MTRRWLRGIFHDLILRMAAWLQGADMQRKARFQTASQICISLKIEPRAGHGFNCVPNYFLVIAAKQQFVIVSIKRNKKRKLWQFRYM